MSYKQEQIPKVSWVVLQRFPFGLVTDYHNKLERLQLPRMLGLLWHSVHIAVAKIALSQMFSIKNNLCSLKPTSLARFLAGGALSRKDRLLASPDNMRLGLTSLANRKLSSLLCKRYDKIKCHIIYWIFGFGKWYINFKISCIWWLFGDNTYGAWCLTA